MGASVVCWGTEWDVPLPEFESALARSVAESPSVALLLAGGFPRARFDDAVLAAQTLRRLEALEDEEVPPAERSRVVLEMLRGLEALARVGGPAALPFRVRARALAFPGVLGAGLARLDLVRAEMALEASWSQPLRALDTYAYACAAMAPDSCSETGRELYRLGLALSHELAVVSAVEAGNEPDLHNAANSVTPNFRHSLKGLDRWFSVDDFEATPDDRRRAAARPFVYRPPDPPPFLRTRR
jgi:hypothetical protein